MCNNLLLPDQRQRAGLPPGQTVITQFFQPLGPGPGPQPAGRLAVEAGRRAVANLYTLLVTFARRYRGRPPGERLPKDWTGAPADHPLVRVENDNIIVDTPAGDQPLP